MVPPWVNVAPLPENLVKSRFTRMLQYLVFLLVFMGLAFLDSEPF